MRNFKEAVVYQIYIKSFKDSNGDGIGDINGITDKLDYLKLLGVDYIWITPFYKSPLVDNGYDVEDYLSIDEKFGKLDDFERMIKKADSLGIGVMLDMVFNHSSTQHMWFKKALKEIESDNKVEKYRNYYIFKESDKESEPPTNWISKFGGSSWERVKNNLYYLHLFDKTQADLNWENREVREEIYKIINYWREKGVKGFRFDVINLISKPNEFKSSNDDDGRKYYTDGPRIHEYIKEMSKNTFGKDKSLVTVGEMSSTSIDNCVKYSNPENDELNMVFSFHHLKVDYENGNKWSNIAFDFIKLKEIISNWQNEMYKGNGWNALFLNNHDQPRALSRFGDDENYPKESAKMLATMIHMLRGTPYIYQGEEIGMANAYFDDISLYDDVESTNYYKILKEKGIEEKEIISILMKKSRDNARTPMQWDYSENFGFTEGKPWLSLALKSKVNVEENIKDKTSVFNYYKKLISLRHENDIIKFGDFEEIDHENPRLFIFKRHYNGKVLSVILNFYKDNVSIENEKEKEILGEMLKGELLLSNYEGGLASYIRPYEAIVLINDI